MMIEEIVDLIDKWLKKYNIENPEKAKMESVEAIKECANELRKIPRFTFFSDKLPFYKLNLPKAKQYLKKARSRFPLMPKVNTFIAQNYDRVQQADISDRLPDDSEILPMLLIEARQEIGDSLNSLIESLKEESEGFNLLKRKIQIHESIRDLRQAGLYTVAIHIEWEMVLNHGIWSEAIKSGALTPERILALENMIKNKPEENIIGILEIYIRKLKYCNLLTSHNFDKCFEITLKREQPEQLARSTLLLQIIDQIHYCNHKKYHPETALLTLNQKNFDALFQWDHSILNIVDEGLRKMGFAVYNSNPPIDLLQSEIDNLFDCAALWQKNPDIKMLFDRLASHHLTNNLIRELIAVSLPHMNNLRNLAIAVDGVIRRVLGMEAGPALNYNQSIHAPSVERSISRSVMRLAQTGYDLFLKVAINAEDISVEMLEKSNCEVPTLIKFMPNNGEPYFYIYGRTEEGKMQLVALQTSNALQAVDFNKEDKKLWVSKYQNKDIYHAIASDKGHVPQGYSQVINQKASMEEAITELQSWGKGLSDSDLKQKAAKEAVGKLTDINNHYRDEKNGEGSQVSTREMLALVWTAIHDDTRRVGNLEDAKALLMEGFYEIQRGYNIDAQGKDNLGEGSSICTAGSFNKVIEKLQGIHPDVQIDFITTATFTLKLPFVVIEEAMEHVKQHPEDGFLIQKASDLSPVADKIKNAVRKRMWEEFGKLLCEVLSDYGKPLMKKEYFDAAIDSIGSVQPNLQLSFLLQLYSVAIEEAMEHVKTHPEDGVLIRKVRGLSPIADKIKDVVSKRMWEEFGEALCGGEKPFMKKEEFNRKIDTALSEMKLPKNFDENVLPTPVQPEEEVKPKITTITITLRGLKKGEVKEEVKLVVDVSAPDLDIMHMIKERVNNQEDMIVRVMFSGQIYTSSDPDKTKLQTAFQKSGWDTYTLQVLPSKKIEKKVEEKPAELEEVISEPIVANPLEQIEATQTAHTEVPQLISVQPVSVDIEKDKSGASVVSIEKSLAFLKQLSLDPTYQTLMDRGRIAGIRKENKFFQDYLKNQKKEQVIKDIEVEMNRIVNLSSENLTKEAIYNPVQHMHTFINNRKIYIDESTSTLSPFFQQPVTSRPLIADVLSKLDDFIKKAEPEQSVKKGN